MRAEIVRGIARQRVSVVSAVMLWHGATAQEHVSFPTEDGGSIQADVYGRGDRGVVLAHGGQFNKGGWAQQAEALADAGFHVVAIDFRGYGGSTGPGQADPMAAPLYLDVLAAVDYLKGHGAATVSIVGASMGGGAAGDASIHSAEGDIDRVVFLASPAAWHEESVEGVKGRKLFIVTRDDADGSGELRLPAIRKHFEEVSEPKRLVVLEGAAHAQFIFDTDQGDRVVGVIIEFLSAP